MRVRILSGNETGTIKDLPEIEGEVSVQTGFAERVEDLAEVPPAVAEAPTAEPEPEPKPETAPETPPTAEPAPSE